MTSEAERNTQFLMAMNVDMTKAYDVAIGYFIGLYVHKYIKKHPCDFLEPIRNGKLPDYLRRCNLPHTLPADWESETDFYGNLEEKYQALDDTAFTDCQRFFSSIGYGTIVQNWDAFHAHFRDMLHSDFWEALSIAAMMQIDSRYPNPEENWDEITSLFSDTLSEMKIGSKDDFLRLREMIFQTQLQMISVSENGDIISVQKLYSKYFLPYNQLLEDYASVKLHSPKRDPLNPWMTIERKRHPEIESGVSVEEILYNHGAYHLREHKPLDVINAVFYVPERNDSAFEVGYLAPKFQEGLELFHLKTPLIVNPSPDFIRIWQERHPGMNTTFAVPSKTVADLYDYQFHTKGKFIPFDDICDDGKSFDGVLVMSRDWERVEELIPPADCIADDAFICAQLPNAWLDGDVDDVNRKEAVFDGYCLQELILLDGSVTNSKPRKKNLVLMRKQAAAPGHTVKIRSSRYDKGTEQLRIEKNCAVMEQGAFVRSTLCLISLKQKLEAPDEDGTHYKPAQVYDFSREIKIHYSIMADRKHSYAGQAVFRKILDGSQKKTRTMGESLTKPIEKGLRAKTEAAVIRRIESIPYDERMESVIVPEIFRVYGERMETVSLKTMWYVLRSYLKKNRAYDDELCQRMFDPEVTDLHQLYVSNAYLKDYERALGPLIDDSDPTASLLWWKQLNLILSQIVSHGYSHVNPIRELLDQLQKSATAQQQEVRNAMTKKSFTQAEEQKIYAYLMEEDARGRKRCVTDSYRLASVIRFYTGMDVREICALKWSNFQPIADTGFYQLCITKFVTAQGKLTTDCEKEIRKFRRVPLSPVVSELLLERKAYLQMGKESARAEPEMPIISPKGSAVVEGQVVHCKPRPVAEKCRDMVKAVEISEKLLHLPDEDGRDMITDISKYNGDIFRSHFKYRANHTCKLRKGEINYLLGITPPDTFSMHYCDYMHDAVQAGMAKKLYRWETLHQSAEVTPPQVIQSPVSDEPEHTVIIGPYQNGCSLDNLIITPGDEPICLDVRCDHGLDCTVTHFRNEVKSP